MTGRYPNGPPHLKVKNVRHGKLQKCIPSFFAHPLVEGITTWDPADGAWLGAPSGLMRKDSSLKPIYHKLHSLIHGEWKTDVTLKTDDNGYVTLDGYKGLYEAAANGKKAEFTLSDGAEKRIILE